MLFQRVAVQGGKSWEAGLWLQLVQCEELLVQTDGGNLQIPQTNGVRQGSPDSPVGSHRNYPREERRRHTPAPIQWQSVYGRHISMGRITPFPTVASENLSVEGLHINEEKIECVCSHPCAGETITVGGQTVPVRGPDYHIKVLGASFKMSSVSGYRIHATKGQSGARLQQSHILGKRNSSPQGQTVRCPNSAVCTLGVWDMAVPRCAIAGCKHGTTANFA